MLQILENNWLLFLIGQYPHGPVGGLAMTLFMATHLGIPVSTTHTITGAIIGVGAARRASAVRWNVASTIVVAWIITLPAAAAIGALTYLATGML